ncbi:MAG: tetratricopeptide repeat protein [Terracidiphilus sp.]|jgi:tetratricopeptide (TPR) repeat protein
MKRTISLWLGLPAVAALLAFAVLPVLAQTPAAPAAPKGKIHGHVTNPTGVPAQGGTVSLSTDGGPTSKYTFQVSTGGDYSGEASPGTYTIVFRQPDTPPDKMVDFIDNVKIVAGQDVLQDMDMTRKEFVDKLTPEMKKQLEDLKKHNAEAIKTNELVKVLNADLIAAGKDIKDADNAGVTARQALGATASRTDVDAKEAEIKLAKYTEIETMMLKDTAAKPDASVLWMRLGQAQLGLKKYDEAEASFKKTLELDPASKKPNLQVQGTAEAGLGEIYARAGKVPEANAAYDAAAKVDPTSAGLYLKNEAVIFSQLGNTDAQVAAADEAIKVAPNEALAYYLKASGLVQKTTQDPKTKKLVAPPGCLEAYQKYLELAPTGQYAGDVKGILAGFEQTIDNTYKAPKTKK